MESSKFNKRLCLNQNEEERKRGRGDEKERERKRRNERRERRRGREREGVLHQKMTLKLLLTTIHVHPCTHAPFPTLTSTHTKLSMEVITMVSKLVDSLNIINKLCFLNASKVRSYLCKGVFGESPLLHDRII